MQRRFLSFLVLLLTLCGSAFAWDFQTQNSDGLSFPDGGNKWSGNTLAIQPGHSVVFDASPGQTVSLSGKASDQNHTAKFSFVMVNDEGEEISGTSSEYSLRAEETKTYGVSANGKVKIKVGSGSSYLYITALSVNGTSLVNLEHGTNADAITFIGSGVLGSHVYKLPFFTFEIGNGANNNTARTSWNDDGNGFFAYVNYPADAVTTDANGIPTGGTFFVIKPTEDGELTLNTWSLVSSNALKIVDSEGHVKRTISNANYKKGTSEGVGCGVLFAGKTYYIYAESTTVLMINKAYFKVASDMIQFADYDNGESVGDSTWVANTTSRAWVANEYESGDPYNHGQYAKINFNDDFPRSVIYPLTLGTRKTYTIDLDFALTAASAETTQFAVCKSIPSQKRYNVEDEFGNIIPEVVVGDVSSTDFLFSLSAKNSTSWTVMVLGNQIETVNLTSDWHHLQLQVESYIDNGTTKYRLKYKIVKITAADGTGSTVTNNTIELGTEAIALNCLAFYTGGNNGVGKFDNIKTSSTEKDYGTVTTPKVELGKVVTHGNQQYRQIIITAGVNDSPEIDKVRTFWSWDSGTNWSGYFDDIENNVRVPGRTYILEVPLTELSTNKTITVRSVTPWNPVCIESEDVTLLIPSDIKIHLDGGFYVEGMKLESNGYYTPILHIYVDTSLLTQDQKNDLVFTLNAYPIDYGIPEIGSIHLNQDGTVKVWPYTFKAKDMTFDENKKIAFYNFPIEHSCEYTLVISAPNNASTIESFQLSDNNGNEKRVSYYHAKYKVTYQTPDFSTISDPISAFASLDSKYFGTWGEWRRYDANGEKIAGWENNCDGTNKYVWTNAGSTDITSTINSVEAARSRASSQVYNLRTVQRQTNQLQFVPNAGLVKDVSTPWEYRAQLAHINYGNEIPMYKYRTVGSNQDVTVYPTPYINNHNVPECSFTLPARAALTKYQVFTPVETKEVPQYGLVSFSSYYSMYAVDDVFLNNNSDINIYRTQSNPFKYGKDYYFNQTWYCQRREGMVIAANRYEGKDIWIESQETPDWNDSKTVELRILDGDVPSNTWSSGNELKPVLFDMDYYINPETKNVIANANRFSIYGSSTYDPESTKTDNGLDGHPNLILYQGSFEDNNCYNFFTMPKVSNKANMLNKTCYLQPKEALYSQFTNGEKEDQGEGIKIHFDKDIWNDEEVVGIDGILENPAEANRMYDDAFYTISGQKVSNPKSGLYIHNGKKVLVK